MPVIIGAILWIGRLLMAFFSFLRGKAFVTALLFYLFSFAGGIIGRFAKLLGITLVANQFLTPQFTSIIAGKLFGMPQEWVAFIGIVKLDQALTIILSAIAIRTLDQISLNRKKEYWTL